MTTPPSNPLLPDASPSDAPTPTGRQYELDDGPVSNSTLDTIRTRVDQQGFVPSHSLFGQHEATVGQTARIADLLALPGSEDVELHIDRTQELPRAADFS